MDETLYAVRWAGSSEVVTFNARPVVATRAVWDEAYPTHGELVRADLLVSLQLAMLTASDGRFTFLWDGKRVDTALFPFASFPES